MSGGTGARRAGGPAPAVDVVGRGWAAPVGVTPRGGVALVGGADAVDAALGLILRTAPGERVMRPEFGCAVWDLLFHPVNANTLGRMAQAVREAVTRWEPRVELDDVTARPDGGRPGLVLIELRYRIRAGNDRRNLVFPFYVIPEEATP